MADRDLVYVYAVLAATSPAVGVLQAGELPGIDGRAVRPLAVDDLAAAVSPVPSAAFDEAPLNAHVADLAWLGPRAMAHERVNAALLERCDALLPLSFGTVFRDAGKVELLLKADRQRFVDGLARVRGRAEWVVSIQRNSSRAVATLDQTSEAVRSVLSDIASGPPGRAYLLQRRLDALRRQALQERAEQVVQAVLNGLAPLIVQSYPEPVVEATGDGMLTRLSVLVARADEERWRAMVERQSAQWQPEGYDVVATGPWPAYRFSGLAAAAARAEP